MSQASRQCAPDHALDIIYDKINENYIKDIPIGYISEIKVRDYDSSLDIEITRVLDFGRLETVIVVDMKEQNQEAVTK